MRKLNLLTSALIGLITTVINATETPVSEEFTSRSGGASSSPLLPDGMYLFRLLWMRHGMSCANVAWLECTKNASRLSASSMGRAVYNRTLEALDTVLLSENPVSVGGIVPDWGIKPTGFKIPGKSKIVDGLSHECLVKAADKQLEDDEFDEHGNLIAVSVLVKDPHITNCAIQNAKTANQVLSGWMKQQNIELDIVGASTLKRAIESAQLVFKPGLTPSSQKTKAVTTFPYLNERDPKTPTQPECVPYPPEEQLAQMQDVLKTKLNLETNLTSGPGAFPRHDQQYDKFKVVLSLNVLPQLYAGQSPIIPNAALASTLEAIAPDGKPVLPKTSSWEQINDAPLREMVSGNLRYVQGQPFSTKEYDIWKSDGSKEFVVGLGSHSIVIKEYCLEGSEDLVDNFAVVERLLAVNVTTMDGQTTFTVAESLGKCHSIMGAPPAPKRDTLTASDLGDSCRVPFDLMNFVDLQPDPDKAPTSCVASGRDPDAFPLTPSDVNLYI